MDIGSKRGYPASALSNFAPHPFKYDGVQINSMEGFLQSLKFERPEAQEQICLLVGYAAKARGRNKNWQRTQTLHWQGKAYERRSLEYRALIRAAYVALTSQSDSFRRALLASGDAVLKHTMGRTHPNETILTATEFTHHLTYVREALRHGFIRGESVEQTK